MRPMYSCPCIPRPHTGHVVIIDGKPRCTWCLNEAVEVDASEPADDYRWLDGLTVGTAFLGAEEFRGDEYALHELWRDIGEAGA